MNQIPMGRDVHSLVMRNDGALYYNNEEKNRLPANNLPQEGDVVVSFLKLLCLFQLVPDFSLLTAAVWSDRPFQSDYCHLPVWKVLM